MIQDYKLRVNQAAWRKLNSTMYCDTCCDDSLIAAAILAGRARRDARAGAARARTVFVLTQQEGISLTWILCRAIMTHPGDVIAGGSGGMGPCPLAQLEPPGIFVYVLYIYNVYSWIYIHEYMQCIFMYIPCISADCWICMAYTWYIHGIYMVHLVDIGIWTISWVYTEQSHDGPSPYWHVPLQSMEYLWMI